MRALRGSGMFYCRGAGQYRYWGSLLGCDISAL